MNTCNICNNEINYTAGGAALMMAFVRGHTTNLINVSVCETCYKIFMDAPMKMLNEKCMLNIDFGDKEGDNHEWHHRHHRTSCHAGAISGRVFRTGAGIT